MSRLKSSRGMTFMELLCAVLILMMSTALVLVGEFLRQGSAHYDRSKLYDPGFTTGFREATR